MSFLDQAKQAANAALNTAANVAQQATAAAQQASAAAQPTLSAAYNSASAVAQQASAAAQPALSSAAATVASTASAGLTQAQAGLHSVAPNVVPAPSGASSSVSGVSSGVDTSHDLAPHGKGTEKLEQLLEHRPNVKELQDRNILKGAPNDALAGKKADLMRAQLESRLDGQIANRPAPEQLVKEGILEPADVPPAI
ncbi:hypothetical protein QFC22_004342 [Naganishia vaughanmartiniae]|uniref:Uncharacterized protein n=1 Tax=Naganishia vaughanmartiniae TaxID=1424756 RepID=A0ACC2X2H8_9TREE|nr:hypothetical protein QFC22_004342 [Naganishia vaughanmartiniae]